MHRWPKFTGSQYTPDDALVLSFCLSARDLPTAHRHLCALKDRFGLAHRLFAVFE
jgi:hypothetical protein